MDSLNFVKSLIEDEYNFWNHVNFWRNQFWCKFCLIKLQLRKSVESAEWSSEWETNRHRRVSCERLIKVWQRIFLLCQNRENKSLGCKHSISQWFNTFYGILYLRMDGNKWILCSLTLLHTLNENMRCGQRALRSDTFIHIIAFIWPFVKQIYFITY